MSSRPRQTTPRRKAGRPKGPLTIVNLRIPVDLLAQLDRYSDRLEVQTGLKANRGMIARRALELFLETHLTGRSALLLGDATLSSEQAHPFFPYPPCPPS